MSQYMILIYGSESAWSQLPAEVAQKSFQAFMAYNKELAESGVLRSGGQLQSTNTSTTVRMREGKLATTDGPFAETKEQLGGYYVIDVDSLDDALRWASKCPAAQGGSIEVRPMAFVPSEATDD